jgi:periplasmic divalent cation tolerance protein
MKSAAEMCVVWVTAPEIETARALAKAALEARLVACVNLVPAIESHYWWEGRLESAAESLLICKTTRARLPDLERLLRERHPYDTPEILALPLDSGTPRYLDWLADSVRTA